MKKTILIFCAWWQRPDVTRLHLESIEKCKKESKFNLKYLAVLSPEDPYFGELFDLGREFNCEICLYQNIPLGEKHNAGVNYAIREIGFDYFMNIGSDDCIFPVVFREYEKHIKNEVPFFGIMNFYLRNHYTGEELLFNRARVLSEYTMGGCRMIHRSILQKFVDSYENLYKNEINSGLDTSSQQNIEAMGYKVKLIDNGNVKMIEAIKCNTTINHWEHFKIHPKITKLNINGKRKERPRAKVLISANKTGL